MVLIVVYQVRWSDETKTRVACYDRVINPNQGGLRGTKTLRLTDGGGVPDMLAPKHVTGGAPPTRCYCFGAAWCKPLDAPPPKRRPLRPWYRIDA